MVVEGDRGRWWHGVDEVVVVVVGLHIRKCEVGEGLGAKNHKVECSGLISGMMVGLRVCQCEV